MTNSAAPHLLPVFARSDLGFERGEGCWLIATNGERYLDFTSGVAVNALGHAHPALVAALQEQATKLWHMSNLFQSPDGEKLAARLCNEEFCGLRVLLQFRRRSAGMRDQGRAPLSCGEGPSRPLSHDHLRRRLPRPHAGDAGCDGFGKISRRFRPADGGLRPGPAWRSRRGEKGDRSADRRHPDRADPGRGRCAFGDARLPQGVAPALRREGPAARLRRGADRHGPHRRSVRVPPPRRRRPT